MAAENAGSIFADVRIRLDKLKQDLVEATTSIDKFEKTLSDGAEQASKKTVSSLNAMSIAAVVVSAKIVNAFRSMLVTTGEYGQALSNVQAATRGTSEQLAGLEEAAVSAGDGMATSTTEALGAVEALAKAGVSTADIMGGALPGALTLAAAGTINVSDAAEIAAATMTQFGLSGSDVTHIADLLAAGAGKAQGEVSDLSQALKQAGLVASQTGLSVDDTVGSLAAFASAGLLGSDAGTSFRTMLLRLTPQSKEAADKMQQLGLNAFDAKGEFIGITKFAGQLKDQLSGLTTEQRNSALATIFGSDSIRAANVLYTQGAEGIASWIEKVNDQGFAADVARIKLDNLAGDMKKFGAATTDASAAVGKSLDPALRGVTQLGAAFFEFISKIPEPILTFIGTIGALGGGLIAIAAAGPPVIATLIAIGTAAAAALGPIGLITAAILGIGGAVFATAKALDDAAIKEGLSQFGEMGKEAGLSGKQLDQFAKNTLNAKNALEGLNSTQQKMFNASRFQTLAQNIGLTNDQLAQVVLNSNKVSESMKDVARSFVDQAKQSERLAKADAATWAAMDARFAKDLPKAVEDGGKKVLDMLAAISAAIAYQNDLEAKGLITTEASLSAKIKIRQDEIDRILKTANAISDLSLADQKRIKTLTQANIVDQKGLDDRKQALEAYAKLQEQVANDGLSTEERVTKALAEEQRKRLNATIAANDEQIRNTTEANLDLVDLDSLTTDQLIALNEKLAIERDEANKKQFESMVALADLTLNTFSSLVSALSDVFTALNKRQIDDLDASYQHQRELIENNGLTKKQALEKEVADAIAAGDVTATAEAQKQLDLFNLEADFTRKKAQLQFEAAHSQWVAQVALATASAARAIVEALPNIPLSIIAGVIGAAQIGAVIAAEPQPPKFATGGIVLGNSFSGDNVPALVNSGEMILNKEQQAALFNLANGNQASAPAATSNRPIQLIIDGKVVAQSTADWLNSGQIRLVVK